MAELAFAFLIEAAVVVIELLTRLTSWLADRVRYRRAIKELRRRTGYRVR